MDKEVAHTSTNYCRIFHLAVRGTGEVRAAFALCITRPGEFGFRIYRNNICFVLLTK